MAESTYSWWFTVSRKGGQPGFDHVLNRIEKERVNAYRMGLRLVVEAAPFSDSYQLYTTPSVDGSEVVLFGDRGSLVVPREQLYYNGDYLWLDRTRRALPSVAEE